MPGRASDRNLLFGILALQMDFITRDGLVEGMNGWMLAKHLPLGAVLVERGVMTPRRRDFLEPVVDALVEEHGGDPSRSLEALGSAGDIAADIRRSVDDPDVHASLAYLPEFSQSVQDVKVDAGSARYRKFREHARGGSASSTSPATWS